MKKGSVLAIILMLTCGGAAQAFDPEALEIHGFASAGYLKTTENNYLLNSEDGSFEFNEAGLNVTTALSDRFKAGMQLFSQDQGDVGNNAVHLDWAFLDYKWKEAFGIRVGRVKTPLGLFNEIRDYDMLRTSILLPQGVYSEYYRELQIAYQGVALYGTLPLASVGKLTYDVFGGQPQVPADGIMAKYLADESLRIISMPVDRMIGARLHWYAPVNSPLNGLMFGATMMQFRVELNQESTTQPIYFRSDVPETRFTFFSASYDIGKWTLAGEYQRWGYDGTLYADMSHVNVPNPAPYEYTIATDTYYVLLSYTVTDWLRTGVYYSVYYADRDDRDGKKLPARGLKDYAGWQKDLALSLRFDISDAWIVKLETHVMNGVALCDFAENDMSKIKENWMLFAVKTTFTF